MIESFRALKLSHIEPLYLIRVCLRDLWMIILAALCGAMITGTVLTLFYPNAVGAKVTLVVNSRVASSSVIQSNNAAANTAKTFSELLNTDLVRRRVAQSAGYPGYDGKLSVKVQKDTNLIDVSLTAPTSKQAYALIQSVCNSYDTLTNYVSKNMIVQKFNTPTIYSVPGTRVSRTTAMAIAALLAALLMAGWLIFSYLAQEVIQNENGARDLLDARLITTIGHEKVQRRRRALLISEPTVSFAFAESIQKLCTLLEQKRSEHGRGVFSICSLCEHEGKTMLTDNLAYAMLQRTDRVLIFDADFRKPSRFMPDSPRMDRSALLPDREKRTACGQAGRRGALRRLFPEDPEESGGPVWGAVLCTDAACAGAGIPLYPHRYAAAEPVRRRRAACPAVERVAHGGAAGRQRCPGHQRYHRYPA